jgi:hypothetical protein
VTFLFLETFFFIFFVKNINGLFAERVLAGEGEPAA